jgi:hypothetical protein
MSHAPFSGCGQCLNRAQSVRRRVSGYRDVIDTLPWLDEDHLP